MPRTTVFFCGRVTLLPTAPALPSSGIRESNDSYLSMFDNLMFPGGPSVLICVLCGNEDGGGDDPDDGGDRGGDADADAECSDWPGYNVPARHALLRERLRARASAGTPHPAGADRFAIWPLAFG